MVKFGSELRYGIRSPNVRTPVDIPIQNTEKDSYIVIFSSSNVKRKPDFCLCENKGADSCVTAHLISAFVFAIRIVQLSPP